MADFYVDLGFPGTGGTGTIIDPWYAETFHAEIANNHSGDTFFIQGIYLGSSRFQFGRTGNWNNVTLQNWTSDPWRPHTDLLSVEQSANSILIKNAILTGLDRLVISSATYLDCFFMGIGAGSIEYALLGTFKGCTFSGGDSGSLWFGSSTITDSIFDGSCNFSSSTTTSHCVFTDAILPLGVHTNYQLGWAAPATPAWNDPRTSFASSSLSAGITTPAEPGTPPYIDYELGLWDSTRIGIGSMEFVPPPLLSSFNTASAGDGTTVTSTINKTTIINAISADSYFTDASQIGYVLVNYTHEAGRQNKILVHRAAGADLQAQTSWSADAKDGTWQKVWVKVFDLENAMHFMDRSSIGTGEDIVHSSGVMHLNT